MTQDVTDEELVLLTLWDADAATTLQNDGPYFATIVEEHERLISANPAGELAVGRALEEARTMDRRLREILRSSQRTQEIVQGLMEKAQPVFQTDAHRNPEQLLKLGGSLLVLANLAPDRRGRTIRADVDASASSLPCTGIFCPRLLDVWNPGNVPSDRHELLFLQSFLAVLCLKGKQSLMIHKLQSLLRQADSDDEVAAVLEGLFSYSIAVADHTHGSFHMGGCTSFIGLLISKLIRGVSGIIRGAPEENAFRERVARCFVVSVHRYLFEDSAINVSIEVHDCLLHRILPTVITQTAYEWVWDVWFNSLTQQRSRAGRHGIAAVQTVADIIEQLQSTTFLDRMNAALPKDIRRLVASCRSLPPTEVFPVQIFSETDAMKRNHAVLSIVEFLRTKSLSSDDEIRFFLEKETASLPSVLQLALEKVERTKEGKRGGILATVLIGSIAAVSRLGVIPSLAQKLIAISSPILSQYLRAARASGDQSTTDIWRQGFAIGVAHTTTPSKGLDPSTLDDALSFVLRIYSMSLQAGIPAVNAGTTSTQDSKGDRRYRHHLPSSVFGLCSLDEALPLLTTVLSAAANDSPCDPATSYRVRHSVRTIDGLFMDIENQLLSDPASVSTVIVSYLKKEAKQWMDGRLQLAGKVPIGPLWLQLLQ